MGELVHNKETKEYHNIDAGILLRPAQAADCRRLYEWRSDPLVRQNSFHTEPIAWEDHFRWFAGMMMDPEQRQYILLVDGTPAGQVRIRREENPGSADHSNSRDGEEQTQQDDGTLAGQSIWEIGYSIAAEYRGRGLGSRIIQLLEETIRAEWLPVHVLLARVKPDNAASEKVFEHNGFTLTAASPEYLTFEKKIHP